MRIACGALCAVLALSVAGWAAEPPDITIVRVLDERKQAEVIVQVMPQEIGERLRVEVPVAYCVTHQRGRDARIESWLVSSPGEERPTEPIPWNPTTGDLEDGLGFWAEFTVPENTATVNISLDHTHWSAEGSGGSQIWRKKRPGRRIYNVRVAPAPWDVWARYLAQDPTTP